MEEVSQLQREIRQGKPFRSRGQEVVVALLRTADLVRRVVGRTLEPYDITLQQYNVLRILRGAGEQGLPTLEIAEPDDRAGAGRDPAARPPGGQGAGAPASAAPRTAGRCSAGSPPPGSTLVERLDEPVDSADAEAVAMLTPEEQERLLRMLDAIRAGARRKFWPKVEPSTLYRHSSREGLESRRRTP